MGDASHMGVHHNAWNLKGIAEYDVSRFTPNTGKFHQSFQLRGYFAGIILRDFPTARLYAPGFIMVEPG